jgi:hypothetical protein
MSAQPREPGLEERLAAGRQAHRGDGVSEWAETLPDAFLQCRDFGHTFRPFRAWLDSAMNCYQRVLRCGRCKTERRQALSFRGEILSSTYAYEDGYLAPKGTGRMDVNARAGLRLESTLRLVGHDEKD